MLSHLEEGYNVMFRYIPLMNSAPIVAHWQKDISETADEVRY